MFLQHHSSSSRIFAINEIAASLYQGEELADIDWRVKYHPRARRMILRYDKGVATITMPRAMATKHIKAFLENSCDWLRREINKEKKFYATHQWYSGKVISVLGQKKTLRLTNGNAWVKDDGKEIIVSANGIARQQKKLKQYLWRLAEKEFPKIVAHYCQKLHLAIPDIAIRDPKSRWGSCIGKKHFLYGKRARIMLSFRLILAPPLVLAYLVAHEVCHLCEANHSKDFWALVKKIFPNYKIAEAWLKAQGKDLMRLF
ncbi:MAG: M48 family metallopeptidase [Alphaproteobacteria bacterium]